jgi:NADH dehydrogenase (ubiquinone) Fe-S protein 4
MCRWAASSDTSESSFRKMTFKTAEDAAEFLKKQGIPFEIEEKPENWDSTVRPNSFAGYGDNFSTRRKGIPDLSHLPSNRK